MCVCSRALILYVVGNIPVVFMVFVHIARIEGKNDRVFSFVVFWN